MKYTQNLDYVATGLRELLEYMAFIRHHTDEKQYVQEPEDVLDPVSVRELLFFDDLDRETMSDEEIDVVQYPGEIKRVLR